MRILFLCTGNSCRSQMAEGYARRFAERHVDVVSAGTDPVGVNPRAREVMAADGCPIDGQTSKSLDVVAGPFDLVVTLCGDAAETCPAFGRDTRRIHWPIPDPARATGTEEEIRRAFESARDEIRERVRGLLRELGVLRAGA